FLLSFYVFFFFFQAEDGIRYRNVTGVQTCALPILDDSVVEVHGTYDINVWYSYDDETSTDVEKEIVDYCDVIELSNKDKHCYFHDDEVITEVIRHPNCL